MDVSIPELLSEERSLSIFAFVSVVLGGGAAWLSGRAIAATWRPWWHVALYMLLIGLVVRFFHFALFDGHLVSLRYYVVDTAVCLTFGLIGFRLKRVSQMASHYNWIIERAGLFAWRRRARPGAADISDSR
jgi:hypothetical protein